MKIWIPFFALLFACQGLSAEGIKFFEGTWEEALAKAKAEDKLIFIDAYTAWCGPCKLMSKKVFPLESVGNFYNENFVNVKMDMEKGEGPKFARKYAVRSYPSLLFIESNEEVIHRAVGAKQEGDFIKLGEMVVRKWDKSADFEEEYKDGNRDPEFVMNYVKALNKAGKPSLKIANEYLKTQEDLSTDFNTKFIFVAVSEADSRIFDLMIAEKKGILKNTDQATFDGKILAACNKTVNKAIEYEVEDLLVEAKEKSTHIKDEKLRTNFLTKADMKFYLKTGDIKNYLKVANKFVKKAGKDDVQTITDLAGSTLKDLPTNEKAIKTATGWAKKSYKLEANFATAYTYASALYKNRDYKEANAVAKKGMEFATAEGRNPMALMNLIKQIDLAL